MLKKIRKYKFSKIKGIAEKNPAIAEISIIFFVFMAFLILTKYQIIK